MNDNLETTEFLLKLNADLHAKNEFGNTCLHKAMMFGNFYMIKMLIEKGSDPAALNDYNQTPVYFASNNLVHELGYTNYITNVVDMQDGKMINYKVPEPLIKDME
jgi:ankyrin repeat protein